jgi:hypothetical protein
VVNHQAIHATPGARGQSGIGVGHEGLLFDDVNLERFHSAAGGPPTSSPQIDEPHSLNQRAPAVH